MATYTNEELYYMVGDEIVRLELRKVNRQRGPISYAELKVKWDGVSELDGMIMIRRKLTEIPWFAPIHRNLTGNALMS